MKFTHEWLISIIKTIEDIEHELSLLRVVVEEMAGDLEEESDESLLHLVNYPKEHVAKINRELIIGKPVATEAFTEEELEKLGLVGIYMPDLDWEEESDESQP